MATSGIYRHIVTFDDITEEALDILQIGADGETLSGDMQVRSRKTMNFMLKAWEGQGIHLWTFTEGSLFLVQGQFKYNFATANIANTWFETTLSADEAAGQNILSMTSTTDIAVADVMGIVLDDNTTHFTTVLSKTAAVVTIADVLPSAAVAGSFVRTYVANSFIPANRVMETRRRERAEYEIDMNFESRKDYFHLPDKVTTGKPIQSYFSRQHPEGEMYLWPAPDDTEIVINFTYERPIQVISAGTDNFDIPDYWYEAVIYNLAERLILKFGCTETRALFIKAAAKEYLGVALSYDTDLYPIKIDMGYNREHYG